MLEEKLVYHFNEMLKYTDFFKKNHIFNILKEKFHNRKKTALKYFVTHYLI